MRFDDMEACKKALPVAYIEAHPLREMPSGTTQVGLAPTFICERAESLERERCQRNGIPEEDECFDEPKDLI